MVQKRQLINNKKGRARKGGGLLNKLIDKLPLELHIPGYNYCGPGTDLKKRLQRGDKGVNPLDEACKNHDILYSKYKDDTTRNQADEALANAALRRVTASDSSIGERIAALGVGGVMKAKSKLGMGLKRRKKNRSKRRGGKLFVKNNLRNKQNSKKSKKRIIPIPKYGGFLPLLLPLLGALGAIGGGAAGIAKAVNDAKANREQLTEQKRHNLQMEQAAAGKGLYLNPYKKGSGLYLNPFQKNFR